jgi:prepilin-type N-terminal cleavage/methylation domain-containing protein
VTTGTKLSATAADSGRGGFTLLELLVSIGIISLLAIMLLPIFPRARGQARDANCKSNLSQIWKTVNIYCNYYNDVLFANLDTPLRISNVAYSKGRPTGFGCLYPLFLKDARLLFCPSDPARDVRWYFGWQNWGTEKGEVQVSYGYRGGQGIVPDPAKLLAFGLFDKAPKRMFAADYYEPFAMPPRIHHEGHVNLLRCSGQVDQVSLIPSFGPNPEDFDQAVAMLDR